jgi:hypothetical protein
MGTRVPSSSMSNLLPRTIARASAKICRCPTERLLPPLAIWLSSVRRPSSSSVCREKSPEARSALFSVASSYWENGSRFSRSELVNNSGYEKQMGLMGQGWEKNRRRTHDLRYNCYVRAQRVQVDCTREYTVVVHAPLREDAAE